MKINATPFWKHPLIFCWDFGVPCPYVWLGWWLVTWGNDNDDGWLSWSRWKQIDVSFQPD